MLPYLSVYESKQFILYPLTFLFVKVSSSFCPSLLFLIRKIKHSFCVPLTFQIMKVRHSFCPPHLSDYESKTLILSPLCAWFWLGLKKGSVENKQLCYVWCVLCWTIQS